MVLPELLDVMVPKAPTRKLGVILFLLPMCLFKLSHLQLLLLCMMKSKALIQFWLKHTTVMQMIIYKLTEDILRTKKKIRRLEDT